MHFETCWSRPCPCRIAHAPSHAELAQNRRADAQADPCSACTGCLQTSYLGLTAAVLAFQAPEAAAKSTAGALKGIVKALQLTPVQRQTLGWIRDRQLRKVVALADARRELIMRVRQPDSPGAILQYCIGWSAAATPHCIDGKWRASSLSLSLCLEARSKALQAM